MKRGDRVTVTIAAACMAALFLFPFMSIRVTRLSPAEGLSLLSSLGPAGSSLLLGLLLALLASGIGFLPTGRQVMSTAVISVGLEFLVFWFSGSSAANLVSGSPFARVSLSSGAWVLLVGSFVLFRTALLRLSRGSPERIFAALLPLVLLVPFLAGKLDSLSFMVEFANRSGRFMLELRRHVALSFVSVVTGAVLGIPLGYASTRSRAVKGPAFAVAGTLQTFPSLALFGLLIVPLAWAAKRFSFLQALGVGGIGWAPAYIALSLYSLLPIVQNTFAGFDSLLPEVLDAANGMGMSRRQRLFRVEVPLAAPIVLGGVRVASVQALGNTAVAALIGAGGLGTFIFQGLGEAAPDLILLGALPILLMAVLLDGFLDVLVRFFTPHGIREEAG